MFKLKFLPATIGDSIWITYGTPGNPRHILIDGGTRGTRRRIQQELTVLPPDQRKFELMVVSHIDKDHIGGILTLLQKQEVDFEIEDFWFNAFRHLPAEDNDDALLGVDQGEQLTAALVDQEIAWNAAFGPGGQEAVVIPDTGPLPKITLAGGMEITLLSPTKRALTELRSVWEDELEKAGMVLGMEVPEDEEVLEDEGDDLLRAVEPPDVEALSEEPFKDDTTPANGSSITFLAEFEGKRVLFGADAQVGTLVEALERVSPGERLQLDLFKISHHGSKTTTSRELIAKLDCPCYVFSTNGSIYKHPHGEAVSRVIVEGGANPHLYFNYKGSRNEIWGNEGLQAAHGYTTTYPSDDAAIEISL